MRPLVLCVALPLITACTDPGDSSPTADTPKAAVEPGVESSGDSTLVWSQTAYTDLDLTACDVLEEFEEGGGVEFRCPGYAGVPLYVSEGDLRFDVDVGVPNERWDSQAAFNTLGERVEWRLRDGVPFAIILRYHMDSGLGESGSTWSELAVISVGTEDEPGCLVGWVPGEAEPSQNEAARVLANRVPEGAPCLD